MKRETTVLTWLGGITLVVVLSPFIYLLCGPALDRHAREKAAGMCDKIMLGTPVHNLISIAHKQSALLIDWEMDEDGGVRYEAQFSGFGANQYICSVYTKGQIVLSKVTDEHLW